MGQSICPHTSAFQLECNRHRELRTHIRQDSYSGVLGERVKRTKSIPEHPTTESGTARLRAEAGPRQLWAHPTDQGARGADRFGWVTLQGHPQGEEDCGGLEVHIGTPSFPTQPELMSIVVLLGKGRKALQGQKL